MYVLVPVPPCYCWTYYIGISVTSSEFYHTETTVLYDELRSYCAAALNTVLDTADPPSQTTHMTPQLLHTLEFGLPPILINVLSLFAITC